MKKHHLSCAASVHRTLKEKKSLIKMFLVRWTSEEWEYLGKKLYLLHFWVFLDNSTHIPRNWRFWNWRFLKLTTYFRKIWIQNFMNFHNCLLWFRKLPMYFHIKHIKKQNFKFRSHFYGKCWFLALPDFFNIQGIDLLKNSFLFLFTYFLNIGRLKITFQH